MTDGKMAQFVTPISSTLQFRRHFHKIDSAMVMESVRRHTANNCTGLGSLVSRRGRERYVLDSPLSALGEEGGV
jgi:hypothetical protein